MKDEEEGRGRRWDADFRAGRGRYGVCAPQRAAAAESVQRCAVRQRPYGIHLFTANFATPKAARTCWKDANETGAFVNPRAGLTLFTRRDTRPGAIGGFPARHDCFGARRGGGLMPRGLEDLGRTTFGQDRQGAASALLPGGDYGIRVGTRTGHGMARRFLLVREPCSALSSRARDGGGEATRAGRGREIMGMGMSGASIKAGTWPILLARRNRQTRSTTIKQACCRKQGRAARDPMKTGACTRRHS